jgi:dihydrofolate reductase
MGKLRFGISTSLDGYVAGPNPSPDDPLGEGGEQLHEWALELESWRSSHGREGGETNASSAVIEEAVSSGAEIMGRRMFGGGPGPWGDDPWQGWWGDEPPFHKPVFVLTNHAREPLTLSDTTFTFVTDGIEAALEQAQAAAGDKDVSIGGGADVGQQYLKAGLLDEVEIHLTPVLLGDGTPLLHNLGPGPPELECTRVIEAPGVTHLKYRVVK